MTPYINDLENIVNLKAISEAGIKVGIDPLGGSGIHFWPVIAKKYDPHFTVVNDNVDP